jgi:hypothetical protein
MLEIGKEDRSCEIQKYTRQVKDRVVTLEVSVSRERWP